MDTETTVLPQSDPSVRPFEANALVLVPATETADQVSNQLVPRGGPNARTLHDTWNEVCGVGDKFFVQALTLQWYHVRKGQRIPVNVMGLATAHHFAIWSPRKNSLVPLTFEQLERYARSSTKDGIIYIDEKIGKFPDRGRVTLTGQTTEERLHQLQEDSITHNRQEDDMILPS